MTIHEKVAAFCAPYLADPDSILTAESLTTTFIDQQMIADWPKAPEDMRAACYIGVQQIVRPILRRHARDDIEDDPQAMLDLPEEALLQDRYSVPVGRGKMKDFKYVPRHRLTEADVIAICDRDRKLSRLFARRADALESWFYRSQPQPPRPPMGDQPRPAA